MMQSILLFWISLFASLALSMPICNSTLEAGSRCRIHFFNLSPTQSSVGMRQIQHNIVKFNSMSAEKFEKYLKKHAVPVIISPNLEFYMIDRHHMAFAILQSERDNKPLLYAEVIQNWSSFSYKDFWQEMISENYIWMFDENGQEFYDPSKLPSSLSDMRDDPYRSLAWVVRERGGFDNSNVPYAELMWANFFRSLVRVGIDSSDEEFEEAADIGVKLARSESASHLPGFKPKFRYINPL